MSDSELSVFIAEPGAQRSGGGGGQEVRRRLRGGPTGHKSAVESGSPSSINEDGFEQGKQGAFLKGPGWEGGAGRDLSSR